MSNSYRLSSRAEVDLAEIWLYIARNDIAAAEQFMQGVRRTFSRIAKFPLLGEARPQHGERIRIASHGRYIVYYEPEEDGVYIVRVIHGARDTTSLS